MEYFSWIALQFSAGAETGYREWYAALEKPFFAPEPFVFGLAWGIIYPLIAIAFLLAILQRARKQVELGFIGVFVLNLVLNLTFSATLLVSRDNVLISLHILAVLASLIWLQALAWRRNKLVFTLLIPYLLWGAFATVLQVTITFLN